MPAGGDGCSVVGPVCDRVATWGSAEVCQTGTRPVAVPDGTIPPRRYRFGDIERARAASSDGGGGVTSSRGWPSQRRAWPSATGRGSPSTGSTCGCPRAWSTGSSGPNGAGKTTTMRILTGLIRADAGKVELLGRPFGRRDRRRLFDVGALIESPAFYPFLSGRENLRALAATGAPVPSARIDELLALVNLHERAGDRVSGYSLGMKQRLGIAAALLSDPRLLLLDEPANGLDPAGIVGDARHAARARRGGQDGVRVEPHPVRGPAAGRRGRDHRPRPAGSRGPGRGPAPGAGSIRVRVAPDEVAGAAEALGPVAAGAAVTPGAGPEAGWLTVRDRPRPWRGGQPGAGRRPGSSPRGSRPGRRSRACSSSSPGRSRTWREGGPPRADGPAAPPATGWRS